MRTRDAWTCAAGAVLLAVGIGFIWRSRVIPDESKYPSGDNTREVVRRFADDIRATDLADDAACRAALARIDAERERWQAYSTEDEILAWRMKIQAAVDARARPR